MDKKEVGQRLLERRNELEWAPKEAGIRVNKITEQYVGQLEKGKIPDPWETLYKICKAYGFSADWVLGLPNAPEPPKPEPLPEGAQEIINYLSSMSGRGREQLLRIAKVLYDDDQEWRKDQDLRSGLKLILGDTTFAAIEAELPAMVAEPSSVDAAVRRILDALRKNLDSNGS